jgi:hypothetical protein
MSNGGTSLQRLSYVTYKLNVNICTKTDCYEWVQLIQRDVSDLE